MGGHLYADEKANVVKQGTIRGRIIDTSKQTLPGASIYIENLKTGVISDVNGFYTFANLNPGTYTVKVTYVGYAPVEMKITIPEGKTLERDVILNEGVELQEIVIGGAFQGQRRAINSQKNSLGIKNVVSADMIQTIEVSKVVTSDMDADAIGGSINLVTKNSPYKRTLTATAGSGYNWISEKAQLNLGLTYGDHFFNDKLGVMLSASYQNAPSGSYDTEFLWEKDDKGNVYINDYQIRQYYVTRERQSYSAALDWDISENHKLMFKGIFNNRNDWENRYRKRPPGTPTHDGLHIGRRASVRTGVYGLECQLRQSNRGASERTLH